MSSYPDAESFQTTGKQITVFDMILPPQAVPMLALLFLITPLMLLTGESLFVPLIEWLKSKMMLGNESAFDMLPFHFYVKLIAFLVLSFFGAFQLLLRINASYYSVWAKSFPRPHALHTDYHPHKFQSITALTQWKLYRMMMIVVPPVAAIGITTIVGLIEFYLFNVLGELPFISLSIQFTVGIFIMMILGMLCLFAVLNSLWNVFTTLFGDAIAVSEPELSPKVIYDRSNRIAFSSPTVYLLYPIYFLFCLLTLGLMIWLIVTVDVYDLLSFKANLPLIALCELLVFVLYWCMNYFRFYTYHQSLGGYYQKLPKQMKEFFSAPPSATA